MFQGPKTVKALNYSAFPFRPADIDAVLLTHAHIDHSGLLPKLIREGYRGEIMATQATIDLCSCLLPDAGSIQESEVEMLNRRNKARGRAEVSPIYTQADAVASLKAFRPVEYQQWFEVIAGVRARYWNAGHLLGSASIEIEFAGEGDGGKPLRILASGDLGPDAKLLQPDPDGPSGLDYVISESTYGDRDRPAITSETRRKHLAAEIREAYAANGPILIPAFAVERTQELIIDIVDLMDRGAIPAAPIFLDSPLAIRATKVFRQHADSFNSGIDVNRLLQFAAFALHRVGRRQQVDREVHRLSHHHRGERHVRRRPHQASPQALAMAAQCHGAAVGVSGARHARAFPDRGRQVGADSGR